MGHVGCFEFFGDFFFNPWIMGLYLISPLPWVGIDFDPLGFGRSRLAESEVSNLKVTWYVNPMRAWLLFFSRRWDKVGNAGWGYPKEHVQLQPWPVRVRGLVVVECLMLAQRVKGSVVM